MGKVLIKTTVKLRDQDKKNIKADIPRLNASLAHKAVDTSLSEFVRLISQDLHLVLDEGLEIEWPPRLMTVQKRQLPKGPKKSKPASE